MALIKVHDVEIKVQSLKESSEETKKDLKKILVEGYRPEKPMRKLSFQNFETAGRFLTPKRLELLRLIKRYEPESIYGLAKLAERNVVNVGKDVKELKELGLVSVRIGRKNNRKVARPSVEFEEINIKIPIAIKA